MSTSDDCACHYCKVPLTEDNTGEELFAYQLVDFEDGELIPVCIDCEKLPEHLSNAETCYCNRVAEESYQEWCAEQNSEEQDE